MEEGAAAQSGERGHPNTEQSGERGHPSTSQSGCLAPKGGEGATIEVETLLAGKGPPHWREPLPAEISTQHSWRY